MEYRNLGKAGLKISELSFGSWLTFGTTLSLEGARQCMRVAFENGVNFFDTAETYGEGAAELYLGEAMRDYKREDLVISTKLFWGGKGPNMTGLSSKHLIEGAKNSLRRLQTDYVDLLFCHRPDPNTPIEETVRAMDYLVRSGRVFYWGTSEWSPQDIEKAHEVAAQLSAIPPSMEQPQYNLFCRNRVEHEYLPLYKRFGMGTTIWSPLAFGLLSGRYNEGIPPNSRLEMHRELRGNLTEKNIAIVKRLSQIADELNMSVAQLSLAWCLKNQHVSTVILGASNTQHLLENLKASHLKSQLTEDVMRQIAQVFEESHA